MEKKEEIEVAILFADVVGYSKFSKTEFIHLENIFEEIEKNIKLYKDFLYFNIMGDGLLLIMYSPNELARFSLNLRDEFEHKDWEKLGFSSKVQIRIALHYGKVTIIYSEDNKVENIVGKNIMLCARLESITQPNNIFCSKEFANLLSDKKITTNSLGDMELAKNFGKILIYKLDWSSDEYINKMGLNQKIKEEYFGNTLANDKSFENKIKNKYFKNAFSINDSNVEAVLNAKELASEFATLIKNFNDEKGQMVGIFGKWGRGKTYLFDLISKKLEREFIRVDFHSWKYQDTPAIWAYLYEKLSNKFYDELKGKSFIGKIKSFINNFWKILKLNFKKNGYFKIILFVFVITSTIAIYLYSFSEKLNLLFQLLKIIGGLSGLILVLILKFKYQDRAINLISKYSKKTNYQNILGIQAEIEKDIKILLDVWIKDKKVLLFVDDIDRCREDKIIEIIDSLRIMLEDKEIATKLIVVVAVDETILTRAIGHKYKEFNDKDIRDLTREYIDKLFIFGIKLGNLNYQNKCDILGVYCDIKDEVKTSNFSDQEIKIDETYNIKNDESEIEEELELKVVESEIEEKDKYTITLNEKEFLDKYIELLENPTPRKIRIFYYRYLFAKRLLNIELNDTILEVLIFLIALFDKKENFDKLHDIKEVSFKNDFGELENICGENLIIKLKEIDKEVLKNIIEIIEITIPY